MNDGHCPIATLVSPLPSLTTGDTTGSNSGGRNEDPLTEQGHPRPCRKNQQQQQPSHRLFPSGMTFPLPKPLLVPPLNFAMVAPGLYRSGYPNRKNDPFLRKLGLRSIICLSETPYTPEGLSFVQEEGIVLHHIIISENKEPFKEMDPKDIAFALTTLLDTRNHPILLHCNKGKHRVGCLVGCLRKLQHYSMTCIFDEYRRFAGQKIRMADHEFIEVFDEESLVRYDERFAPAWLTQ